MSEFLTIADWRELLEELHLNDKSIAIGVFNLDGTLIDANHAMCYFLDTTLSLKNPVNKFVNPEFSRFTESVPDGNVFKGMLTIGNYSDISYTLDARVFKRGESIMVYAEADVIQLFHENNKLSHLNQEVNNLQRQLIKEKRNLQETLKELRDTQQMLIHSEKMNAMGKLVAGVAHEINNPISYVYLNLHSLEKYTAEFIQAYKELENLVQNNCDQGVIGLAGQIRERNDLDFIFDDVADMTKQSRIGIERVKAIVEDLRKFSRLDEADLKEIDLVSNLKATIAIAASELKNRNIACQLIAPEKLMVECYPGQLNQALLNVIINATQAIEKDGNLIIDVEKEKEKVKISVIDDGIGIPENIRDKIFDPFFTTKPVGTGTGLGLSITYKIITEMHNGYIKLESAEGKGTTFTIFIPLKQFDNKSLY